ncbi:MAG: hypothetical protein HYZ29_36450 [Myxococcales bacterium]|nr:hypothetical protein [Myxococcales bacterium]
MDAVWQRVLDRLPSAVVGPMPDEPAHDPPFVVLRVDCKAHSTALGALSELRERACQLVESSSPALIDQAAQRVWTGLRRRLLGDMPDRDTGALLVDTLNRVRTEDTRPIAVVLERAESLDAASAAVLLQILERPGWLQVPVVLHCTEAGVEGQCQRVVEGLRTHYGDTAVIAGEAKSQGSLPQPRRIDLPPDVRRVVRAAAVIGPSFEVSLVAALIDQPELEVLYALQVAKDLGVPLTDAGGGRLQLTEDYAEAERNALLPSLSGAWHKRLARLLAERVRSRRADASPPSAPRSPSMPPTGTVPPPPMPRPSAPPPSMPSAPLQRAQPGRAARHAEAAGDVDLAVEQYVAAAHRAAEEGAHEHAANLANRALDLLGRTAVTSKRRLLRVMALLALARVKWRAQVEGEPSGLSDALELIGECRARLLPTDPVELRAEVAALSAAVHYDLGDATSLDKALAELGEASRALLEAGKPLDAARLLNDEAAVWVRAGDPVRSHHLLMKSREIFAERAPSDPSARLELAETDHLLGRLVLHAPPRPGHEHDALEVGIEHATRAEAVFRELDKSHELGRVYETLGRLELAAGRPREAVEHLGAAAQLQQRIADVIGLARTSAALAEVARESGDLERAVVLLGGSVELNLEKGSPLGLAFNRRALETLHGQLTASQRRELHDQLGQVAQRLDAAERTVGRIALPTEALGLRHTQRPTR